MDASYASSLFPGYGLVATAVAPWALPKKELLCLCGRGGGPVAPGRGPAPVGPAVALWPQPVAKLS